VKIACERLLVLFILVAAVALKEELQTKIRQGSTTATERNCFDFCGITILINLKTVLARVTNLSLLPCSIRTSIESKSETCCFVNPERKIS